MRQNKKQQELNFPRIRILRRVALALFAIIAIRLFFIQVIEHDTWVARANEEHTLLEEIVAKRGEIYMMDGDDVTPVVLNQTTYAVIIDPSITEKEQISRVLTENAPGKITADLGQVYATEGLRYYVVARNVSHSEATKIAEAEISGVWFQKNNQRVYPEGEMAAEVLGFVNADGIGQYGVEGALNDVLTGKNGLLKTIADVNKVALSIGNENVKIPARDGENIVLTLDRGLQQGIEEITAGYLAGSSATNGAVLVMRPETGEVVAMVNLPNYDPADYGNVRDASAYVNYTTEVPYEPASICKSFAFSAALNEGVMTPDTTFFNQHYEDIDGNRIRNADRRGSLYGTLDMRTGLALSLNTSSIYALKLLGGNETEITAAGREKLYDYYYNRFRLGQLTGVELMEAAGMIIQPDAEMWGLNAAYANMTFGQNLNITMIQTLTAFSAVVNGGYYLAPTILKGALRDGEVVTFSQITNKGADESSGGMDDEKDGSAVDFTGLTGEKAVEQILTEETSATMRELLINNRSSKVRLGIDRAGYAIGGKTGTGQVVVNGVYSDVETGETTGSYAGFLGSEGEKPEYTIMVKLWGEGQRLEGSNANELFDKISNYMIDFLKIKPKV